MVHMSKHWPQHKMAWYNYLNTDPNTQWYGTPVWTLASTHNDTVHLSKHWHQHTMVWSMVHLYKQLPQHAIVWYTCLNTGFNTKWHGTGIN